jgi:hypothetical protein
MIYAFSFQLQNRTEDFSRLSLTSLLDISCGINLEKQQLYHHHTSARKALEKLLRAADTYSKWVPAQGPDLLYDTGLNRHLGEQKIISPGRSEDIDGA